MHSTNFKPCGSKEFNAAPRNLVGTPLLLFIMYYGCHKGGKGFQNSFLCVALNSEKVTYMLAN